MTRDRKKKTCSGPGIGDPTSNLLSGAINPEESCTCCPLKISRELKIAKIQPNRPLAKLFIITSYPHKQQHINGGSHINIQKGIFVDGTEFMDC